LSREPARVVLCARVLPATHDAAMAAAEAAGLTLSEWVDRLVRHALQERTED
jgi:predicted HicB family RNase H-like nuclease